MIRLRRGAIMDDSAARRGLLILLAAAAFLFTANSGRMSLPPLDDCHYAQKGVEALRHGSFFTVRWGDAISVQHPPLQFWLLSRSFALFGLNDFAARLPSILMALGVLVLTFAIGRRTLGPDAALAGTALLLLTNTFLLNARRCMLEMPTCFWVALFLLVWLESLRRPRLGLLLSVPLAAVILTKSVVGLVPIAVVASALPARALRPASGAGRLAAGVALGVVGGASWTVHQTLTLGWSIARIHYFSEVGRALADSGPLDYVLAYPRLLLTYFQPVVIPGLVGAVLVWRRSVRERLPAARFLSLWVIVWLVVASLGSARSSRYVWPTVVPLALLSGWLLAAWSARAVRILARWVVPAALAAGGVVYWVSPGLISRDVDAPFKAQAAVLRGAEPEGSRIPLLGSFAWDLANPLLYYGHQLVGTSGEDPAPILAAAEALSRPVLLVEKSRLGDLEKGGVLFAPIAELPRWSLVELEPSAPAEP